MRGPLRAVALVAVSVSAGAPGTEPSSAQVEVPESLVEPSTAPVPGAAASLPVTGPQPAVTTASSADVSAQADTPTFPIETLQVPAWAALGAAHMEDGIVCEVSEASPETLLSVLTSTSAVHFTGCVHADGNLDGGASVYMQPDPSECLWVFQYQTTCGSDEVTLVWQADASRGFVPDQQGVTGVSGPDAVLTGMIDRSPAQYRFFGDPQQGFSVIEKL